MNAKKLSLSAMLLALALALGYVESFLPLELIIPLPGVKLGLANLVTLWAIYCLEWPLALAILILRCLMGAVFGGGITGLAFSLTGGVIAFIIMTAAKRSPHLSEIGVSVLGAAGHNTGQILAAIALMRSGAVIAYLPVLLIAGAVTGTAIGFAGQRIIRATGGAK